MEGDNLQQVGDFTVFLDQQIGHGGFGDVFKAKDQNNRLVAAKRINLQAHPGADIKEAVSFYNRPPEHENLIDLYNITRTPTEFWVFMEYCPYGDLNNYFLNYFDSLLGTKQKLLMMRQIACGIAYLHSMEIVHRDIKPANILVTGSHIPEQTTLKITDLALAKYLDPNGNTSGMNSNLGTEHFKAPEFWLPGQDGTIRYHRSVDTFAAGLTFQAMLQASPGSRLTPALENTLDPHKSEERWPIGQVMVNRRNARQTSVNPVADRKEDSSLTRALKHLIRQMLLMVPEHRVSMQEVNRVLSTEQFLVQQMFPMVTIDKVKTLPCESIAHRYTDFCTTDTGEVIMLGRREVITLRRSRVDRHVIEKYSRDGELLQTWHRPWCEAGGLFTKCRDNSICNLSIQGVQYLAASCFMCKSIRLSKVINEPRENGAWITAYRHNERHQPSFYRMCQGPIDTLLALGSTGPRMGRNVHALFVLDCSSTTFTIKDIIHFESESVGCITYLEAGYQGGLIIFASVPLPVPEVRKVIFAISLRDKQPVWRLQDEVMGKTILPCGMCTDNIGRLYVADRQNGKVLVIDGSKGHVLQVIELPELGIIVDVAWCNTQPHLIICHKPAMMESLTFTYCNVTWESNVD